MRTASHLRANRRINCLRLVLDASVVIKWLLPEEGRPAAVALLDLWERGEAQLFAPRLLLDEVGSVLSRKVRQKSLTDPVARELFNMPSLEAIEYADTAHHARSAFDLSVRFGLSYFERFARAIETHYPFLRQLWGVNVDVGCSLSGPIRTELFSIACTWRSQSRKDAT